MARVVLPGSALGRWSIGFVLAIILIWVLIPVLEYWVGIAEPGSATLRILAGGLGVSGLGALATGIVGTSRKRFYFIVPLLLGAIALISSFIFMLNSG